MVSFLLFIFRYADLISIGDEVLVQEKAQLIPATVTNVSDFLMEGVYQMYLYIFTSCIIYIYILNT